MRVLVLTRTPYYVSQGHVAASTSQQAPHSTYSGMDRHTGIRTEVYASPHTYVFRYTTLLRRVCLVLAVRALLRHGADLSVTIAPSAVDNSPIRAAVGSNVLHIAALTGNMSMAKVVLEAQVCGQDMCKNTWDGDGGKPNVSCLETEGTLNSQGANPAAPAICDRHALVCLWKGV